MNKFQQSKFVFGIVVSIFAKFASDNEEETDGTKKNSTTDQLLCGVVFSLKNKWNESS